MSTKTGQNVRFYCGKIKLIYRICWEENTSISSCVIFVRKNLIVLSQIIWIDDALHGFAAK